MSERNPHITDIDLLLAQGIGRELESGQLSNIRKLRDPLADLLLSYRDQALADSRKSPTEGDWQQIIASIAASDIMSESPQTNILSLNPAYFTQALRWAAVALLVVSALVVWRYVAIHQNSLPVAQAFENIVTWTAPDGSLVTLRPNSKLYLASQSEAEVVYRLSGEARFEVTSNETRRFSVLSGDAKTTVLGTRFVVRDWNTSVEVFVEEGRVLVEGVRENRFSNEITAGMLLKSNNNQIEVLGDVPAGEIQGWLNSELIFQERPLEQIIREVSHHFNIRVEVPVETGLQTLSGRIPLDNINHTLRDIGLVSNTEVDHLSEGRYRLRPKN